MIRTKSTLRMIAFVFAVLVVTAVGSAAADKLDALQKRVDRYAGLPRFVAPGPTFNAQECMRNKKILSIPVSSANPFTQNIERAMSDVAKMVGFSFSTWDNQGQTSQWVQGMDYALNQKVSLIDLLGGTDPKVLVPQVKAATNAGIKVIASHYNGFEQTLPSGISGDIPIHYLEAGELIADWAILKTRGNVNAIVLTSSEVFSTASMVDGIKREFAANCSRCKVKFVNVPITDWSTRIQPDIQAALLADSSINYILPIYDSMSQFVVPAITITGSRNRVKIATFNGTPFVLGLVQQGLVEMDLGENLNWIGHAIIDSEMRIACGLPKVHDSMIPFYIFDQHNAKDAGTPPQLSTGYGNAYMSGFRKLWGLKS